MGYKIVKDSNEHNNKIKKSSNIMKAVKINIFPFLYMQYNFDFISPYMSLYILHVRPKLFLMTCSILSTAVVTPSST